MSNFFLIVFCLSTLFVLPSYAQENPPKTLDDKVSLFEKKITSFQSDLQNYVIKKTAPPAEINSLFSNFNEATFWTEADKKELQNRHKKIVRKAKAQAEIDSKKIGLNLDLIRSRKLEQSFCADLPKGGMLHVHPWGTLDQETVNLILVKQNPLIDLDQLKVLSEKGLDENADGKIDSTLPSTVTNNFIKKAMASPKAEGSKIRYSNLSEDEKKLFQDLFFIKQKTSNFTEFMGVFSLIFNTVFKKDSFSDPQFKVDDVMWDTFLQRAQKEKISYVEVTQTVSPKFGVSKFDQMKKKFKEKYNITMNTIAALDRRQSPDKILTQVQDITALPITDSIVGINLVANEDLHPAIDFKDAYGLFEQKRTTTRPNLSATIHAGEKGNIFNTRDAVAMGVQRIGHGVLLKNDLLTLEHVRTHQVPIEINIVSNLLLDVAPSVAKHPFLFYHRLGIPVSLSTDDEGIFQSTLSKECELIIAESDIYYSELRSMILNSIKNSFTVESEKRALLDKLELDLQQFEKQYVLLIK